jgi:hypothetical protein
MLKGIIMPIKYRGDDKNKDCDRFTTMEQNENAVIPDHNLQQQILGMEELHSP